MPCERANAYYSPHKKAILFGYFASSPANIALHMPNSLVFTCVSHDIIAHEVTHAILDGLYRHYNNPTNPDVLAFHEAFADIVALFQHFTFPDVLKHQIAKTRGNLEDQNLLGQLAQEFGSAIGSYGSLRDALGGVNPKTKKWEPKHPDPHEYRTTMEPHARGSILVAAVFEAFINIYKRRISDLLRIASNGTGILPAGELHPDLVNRLAKEAAKSAGHVLSMCIRALDYCPPVDITFGDYLRAIITADSDLVKNDKRDYRLVFIDAFRKRGIYPQGLKTLSVDSLRQPLLNIGYEAPDKNKPKIKTLTFSKSHLPEKLDDTTSKLIGIIIAFLKDYGDKIKYVNDRKAIYDLTRAFIGGKYDDPDELIQGLHQRIQIKFSRSIEFSRITGLAFLADFQRLGLRGNYDYGMPSFQIQNLRMVSRVGPDGNQVNQVVFSIFQRSGVIMKNGKPDGHYIPEDDQDTPENGFELQGGCTLIFDLDTEKLKYVISKPLLDLEALRQKSAQYKIHAERAIRQYNFQFDEGMDHRNEYNKYFGIGLDNKFNEPFAILHKH